MEPTTRLRKAFKYPTDEESDSQPEDLDEEEQEVLIKTFIDNDAAKTEAYKKAFLFLPILSLLLYAPALLPPSSTTFLRTLLSITSLSLTTYALHLLPTRSQTQKTTPDTTRYSSEIGPLKKYLDHLNAGLSVVLLLFALRAKQKGEGAEEELYLSLLPGVVFLVVYVARGQLRPVDVGELERLRYGYKGA
ncbi:hypothetical protein EG328_007217 [Venturia inaequalis]|uniref:Uncharacterized protein n=1 Tax=Venturia inaequalis TaxID=5025 RepID=A0A8H3UWS1_VENIN|nr:hypothetical protein EG327_007533 [Venturia inaequalis]KAE9985553.1 hypothetical protein EG328_007217 [Venturia inaequalis]RDI82393.1 hypothetical protein Vi05172_g7741 [Venturia inaequalis]